MTKLFLVLALLALASSPEPTGCPSDALCFGHMPCQRCPAACRYIRRQTTCCTAKEGHCCCLP
ncbi:unnamed protein product [Spirodela intermedia]|uniref:Uncharacterized protein n=1 Tax=Spirodela intermedia TaxID=51605 RepID=A0A7I8J8U2_SPIIN|nr:unnamed protein product [Spirodela intermedia]CAA6666460.1 unnamed protein product [Spirodela intermedia]